MQPRQERVRAAAAGAPAAVDVSAASDPPAAADAPADVPADSDDPIRARAAEITAALTEAVAEAAALAAAAAEAAAPQPPPPPPPPPPPRMARPVLPRCTREAAAERRRRVKQGELDHERQREVADAAQQDFLRGVPRLGANGYEMVVEGERTRCALVPADVANAAFQRVRSRSDPEFPPIVFPAAPEERAEKHLSALVYRRMGSRVIAQEDMVAIRDIFASTVHFVLYAHELMYAEALARHDPKFRRADGMLCLVCPAHKTCDGVMAPHAPRRQGKHGYRLGKRRIKVMYGASGPLSIVDAEYACQHAKCPAVLSKYEVCVAVC
jgi:hypothetical protein